MTKRPDRIKALGFGYESQPKEWVRTCNLCDAEYFVQLTQQDRYGYAASASLCERCGLAFLNPRMTADAYRQFYADVYRPLVSAYHGREINSKTILDEQREYAKACAKFMEPFLGPASKGRLLDIGGSTGTVAHYFAEHLGFGAKVLDPSREELATADELGLETIEGFIEDVDLTGERFNLVLLCQTIDHLLDIRKTLETIRHLLDQNGFFFVDIVDFRAAYLRHGRVEEAVKIDHPYYLTQGSTEAYLKRAGFDILKKGYAADYLHINYLCIRGEPGKDVYPQVASVEQLLWELRAVQNGFSGVVS